MLLLGEAYGLQHINPLFLCIDNIKVRGQAPCLTELSFQLNAGIALPAVKGKCLWMPYGRQMTAPDQRVQRGPQHWGWIALNPTGKQRRRESKQS